MCYHPFIFSSFPLFIWAFSFFMECFQNKTLEQGRKRETASETNIPPRSDTLWVKRRDCFPPFSVSASEAKQSRLSGEREYENAKKRDCSNTLWEETASETNIPPRSDAKGISGGLGSFSGYPFGGCVG